MLGGLRQETACCVDPTVELNGVLMPKRVAVTGGLPAWLMLLTLVVIGGTGCRPASSPSGPTGERPPERKGNQPQEPVTVPAKPIQWGNQKVDRQRLERAIQLATDYMVRACDQQGHFQYLVHLDPQVKIYPEYNVVRHVGAMMGLAVAHGFKPAEPTKQALLRANRFLKEKCLGPVDGHPELLAVWSRPEVTMLKHDLQAKLGGTGLGLVALAYLEAIAPGTTSKQDLRKLANFILFMQKENGDFHANYIPAQGGHVDLPGAWMFSGEAALGLLMLYEIDPDRRWLAAAEKAIYYLGESQVDLVPTYPDQWVLQAGRRWVPLVKEAPFGKSRQQIMAHLTRTCQDMLADQRALKEDPRIAGCFARDGITCSTGTCLEGILNAWSCLPEEERLLKQQILESADAGVDFLLKSQLRHGRYAGAWTFITPLLSPDDARLSPHFQAQAEEIRIDYVQHPLCALVRYHQLLQQGVLSSEQPAGKE